MPFPFPELHNLRMVVAESVMKVRVFSKHNAGSCSGGSVSDVAALFTQIRTEFMFHFANSGWSGKPLFCLLL